MIFSGNFAPQGWFFCQGQLLQINQYQALYSILGTIYGGNGTTTFGLPDLRDRVPVGTGSGAAGRQNVVPGQAWGADVITLNVNQLPAHNHSATATGSLSVGVTSQTGQTSNPVGNVLTSPSASSDGAPVNAFLAPNLVTNPGTLANVGGSPGVTIGQTGGNQPISVAQPSLGMNYIICWSGIYPTRP